MNKFGRSEIENVHSELVKRGIQSPLIEHGGVLIKMEQNLPLGSYKIRGVVSYFMEPKNRAGKELAVLSAGNLALATAFGCNEHGINCRAIVPNGISSVKKRGLLDLGATVCEQPFDTVWEQVDNGGLYEKAGVLHPFHPRLLLGYSTIALELSMQAPDLEALVVPFGLGGLCYAILRGFIQLGKEVEIYVCEIEGYAPLSRALKSGEPIEGHKLQSFIEAMGLPLVVRDVYENIRHLVRGVILVSESEAKSALLKLYDDGIRVEGAAAATYAASQKLKSSGKKRIGAIFTGKNIPEGTVKEIRDSLGNLD